MSEVKLGTIKYFCCSDERRNLVKNHPSLNGIDFIEVSIDQKTLEVHFIKSLKTTFIDDSTDETQSHYQILTKDNFFIKGGEKIKNITVNEIEKPEENIIALKLPNGGDFSTYTLHIVQNRDNNSYDRLQGMDLLLSNIDFSFKVNCPDDFDCKEKELCIEESSSPPPFINYLAKDYASFKQLIFDRFSQTLPNWKERNPSDLGVTLIELLAYTADYLSYRQDAVSTEAYLGTCRKRISATRHARLADYKVSNGCNARTYVYIPLDDSTTFELKKDDDIKFLTKINGLPPAIAKDTKVAELAINANQGVFELMHDVELNSKHNEMLFYTFGEKNCCLPKGATFAILKGDYSTLKKHDFLVLTEVKGPSTGLKEDADVIKRHVVRLENIDVFEDFDFKKNDNTTIEITKITWHVEDALPFPLCISSSNKDEEFNDVSIALGNIVLCDYGLTIIDNEFKDSSIQPSVVPASIGNYSNKDGSHCSEVKPKMIPIRYRPTLTKSPLTFSESIVVKNPDKKNEVFSAKRLLFQEASNALPALELTDTIDSKWEAQMDLLIDSTPSSKHFITEVESNGIVSLRFGDDINGARPNAGIQFKAKYRIGNGIAGNIGSDTIYHIIAPQSVVAALTALGNDGKRLFNPLPGNGGKNPETLEEIKQYAPVAFRSKQERAVISDDYSFLAQRDNTNVQKAAAHFRWTGSWNTAFVAVDFKDNTPDKLREKTNLNNLLNTYRLAGLDLEIDEPVYVPLTIEMEVCISENSNKSDVYAMLKNRFSSKIQANGKINFFHADNFSFGDTLYLSNIYKTAQTVPGVNSINITKFHKLSDPLRNQHNIDAGKIEFGKREIAKLDNNPNFRDKGTISFIVKGGK